MGRAASGAARRSERRAARAWAKGGALRAAQRETDKVRQDSVLVATSTAATRQTKLDEFKAEISRLEAQGQTVAGLQVEKISTLGQVKVLAHALRCRLRVGEREHGP